MTIELIARARKLADGLENRGSADAATPAKAAHFLRQLANALEAQQAGGEPVAWMYRISPGPWELTFDKDAINGAHRVISLGVVKDHFEVDGRSPAPVQQMEAPNEREEDPTAEELEAFRRKHWAHWNSAENLLIAHLVVKLRSAAIAATSGEKLEKKQ